MKLDRDLVEFQGYARIPTLPYLILLELEAYFQLYKQITHRLIKSHAHRTVHIGFSAQYHIVLDFCRT